MRILAIDVGLGTQDLLIYDSEKNIENCIKVVLPSMTQVLAKKIKNLNKNVFLYGMTMGGGAITRAIKHHIQKGYKVAMTREAARSIRDDLDRVRKMGIEIVENSEPYLSNREFEKLETKDIDFELLRGILEAVEEKFYFDYVGIGVQDHGFEKGKSDRIFRFEKIEEMISKRPMIRDLGFENPPPYFTRMRAVYKLAKRYFDNILIVDTKFAAIVGALHEVKDRYAIAVDIGNGHTMIGVVRDREILGILEHHTKLLDRERIEKYIVRFAEGKVSNREVFEDGGHGCFIREPPGFSKVGKVRVTGPRRELLKDSKLDIEFASPGGDVMLTGVMGIVDIILERIS